MKSNKKNIRKIDFLIIDTYYPRFLNKFYENHNTEKQSYNHHLKLITTQLFGTSDYYSYYLKKLGHNAADVIANDINLQSKWAKEHGLKVKINYFLDRIRSLPYAYLFLGQPKWIKTIILAQVKRHKPDVVYMQNLSIVEPEVLREIKNHCNLLVGQIACPLPPEKYLKEFDLILTSFPHYPKIFKKLGIKSEYFKIGFDSRVVKIIGQQDRIYDISFIGSFTPHHSQGTKQLEKLAEKMPIHIWGQGLEFLPFKSPLRKNYHGEAWGKDMYKILAQSKIVINRHISAAGSYANNMRLYESTGMGAMLITDKKKNIKDLFIPGKEVIEYKDPDDLVKKIKYYLSHGKEREKIARAGQAKTLIDHSYEKRMGELVSILEKYITK